ncbi:MAG: L,D-transpeptidase [Akkermansiaceae bacterium]|nr:L,D-transpeptidase [Akkermansiaceae bacterium]
MRKFLKSLLPLLSAAVLLSLISCASTKRGVAGYQAYDRPATLPDNPDAVKVKVSLNKQRVYVMEGDKMLLAMPVSVGKSSSPTPRGNFRIKSKKADYRANTHGFATDGQSYRSTYLHKKPAGWSFRGTPMPYWCEFKTAYGFHTGWVKHHPCTHGCIRMHENLGPKFFRLVKVGTPVSIAFSQPEDAEYADMPLPPDADPLPDYDPKSMYWDGGYFSRHKTPVFTN